MYETKAVIYKKKDQNLSIEKIYFNKPKNNEVVVQNLYSGLCGSILINLNKNPKNPELLGHEGTGVVIDKGKGVKHVKIGDKVLISWMPFNADENTKYSEFTYYKYNNTKHKSIIYTLSNLSKIHSQFVTKIPTGINIKSAAIIGCAVISGYLPIIKKVEANSNILIIGMGGLGLLALSAAKNLKLKTITSVDINKSKLEFSKKLGSRYCVNFNDKDFEKKIYKILGNRGYDHIFDFSGNKNVQQKCIKFLNKSIPGYKRGGSFGIAGFHYNNLKISPKELLMYENNIYGMRGGSAILSKDLPLIYDHIKKKKLRINKIITDEFELKDINIAIRKLKKGLIKGRAVIKI